MQDAAKGLRSVQLGTKPSVFVGLDDDTVVIGFDAASPLQAWDLANRRLVRQFEGTGQTSRSILNLQSGHIAVGWTTGSGNVVSVYEASTGKQLYELTGFRNLVSGLALVEDHLLSMCYDTTLRVWSQDSSGKVRAW